jgi:hypothetical protein
MFLLLSGLQQMSQLLLRHQMIIKKIEKALIAAAFVFIFSLLVVTNL